MRSVGATRLPEKRERTSEKEKKLSLSHFIASRLISSFIRERVCSRSLRDISARGRGGSRARVTLYKTVNQPRASRLSRAVLHFFDLTIRSLIQQTILNDRRAEIDGFPHIPRPACKSENNVVVAAAIPLSLSRFAADRTFPRCAIPRHVHPM